MDIALSGALAKIVQAGVVNDNDVSLLRDIVWNEETIEQATVDALFMLCGRCTIVARTWDDFFHEAIEHYLLFQQQPYGFLSQERADWLLDRIETSGKLASRAMIELLISVLERAENAPDRLKAYALLHVEETIIGGHGTTPDGSPRVANCVSTHDASLLRRLIFAQASESATIVSTAEAEMLFRIKDVSIGARNSGAWETLFVQGIGNHLLAHSDYRALGEDEAKWFIDDAKRNTPHLFGFLARMVPHGLIGTGTILEVFAGVFPEDPYPTTLSAQGSRGMTPDQARWLKDHIAADDITDDLEKALLTFIIEESSSVPASLTGLLRQA